MQPKSLRNGGVSQSKSEVEMCPIPQYILLIPAGVGLLLLALGLHVPEGQITD